MTRDALYIGPCHCVTGRQRYRTRTSVSIPWESSWNIPLPPPASVSHTLEIESDSDSDSDIDMNDDQPAQGDQDDKASQEDQSDQEDLSDQENGGEQEHGGDDADGADDEDDEGFFPDDDPPDINSELGDDSDEDDDDDFPDGDKVPPIAPFRLNLTVLSQRYNMYIAAYRRAIHVSRVRSCVEQTLPQRPDLIFRPPASREALGVGGYIDTSSPHQMNHLIIGDLGNEEIILLACDDGDVLGYYTSRIDKALLRMESSDARYDSIAVRPFFHENVGISAWGLAVHKKSRLIAVGNNNRQVHVFAFAFPDPLRTSLEDKTETPYRRDLFLRMKKRREGPLIDVSGAFGDKIHEDFSRHRERGYRFILETGQAGNNIPNVAFGNNRSGDAIDIIAIDISGKVWVLDIWLRDYPPHSFLPTDTFQDSLGLSPAEAVYVRNKGYGYYIGTKKALKYIKDNSSYHPWVRENRVDRFHIAPQWHGLNGLQPARWYHEQTDCREDWGASQDEAADNPSEQATLDIQMNQATNATPLILPDGSSVMRTYEKDIELVGSDHNTGIMFDNVTHQQMPQYAMLPHVPFPPERLANLLHVPELCLVVAGSMCGRVALITPTRPTNPYYSFRRGFRVEAVLPKSSDEDRHLRPMCLLLGVAIGPIPSAGGGNDRLLGDRRYRIMIHYYDHRILSYEVYRNTMTGELSVI
ncbi:hypothetical protein EKO27_g8023 [Xylaria grammica]|uniref:Uncharacterized protein n=1 Tax=Xylaria grammica TaxID=363999 RepID=A0A439CXY0_9PEZI|nr:hypothetical protein EKO27_g8023 [Xylaria grammica]